MNMDGDGDRMSGRPKHCQPGQKVCTPSPTNIETVRFSDDTQRAVYLWVKVKCVPGHHVAVDVALCGDDGEEDASVPLDIAQNQIFNCICIVALMFACGVEETWEVD